MQVGGTTVDTAGCPRGGCEVSPWRAGRGGLRRSFSVCRARRGQRFRSL